MPYPGMTFGRWTLAHVLAQGGAGVVWRAIEARTGHAVAVKLLALDAGGAELAARESEIMVRVRHPGVVRVHTTLEAHGHAAIVMDLARGSLASLVVRAGPLPPSVAIDAVLQACVPLAVAHAAGVVHRDLKPHNLLWFDDAPRVRLGDFGIAHAPAQARTRTQALLGSIPFMAPEQRRDPRAARPATDVYALGVTLAWLLLGEAPDDLYAPGAREHLVAAGIPGVVADLLVQIGAWDVEARPRDGAALAEHLEACRALLPGPDLGAWVGEAESLLGNWDGGAPSPPWAPHEGRVALAARSEDPAGALVPQTGFPGGASSRTVLGSVVLGASLALAGGWVFGAPGGASRESVDLDAALDMTPGEALRRGAGPPPPQETGTPLAASSPPPACTDAVRAWIDDVRMGPRETVDGTIADLDADGHPDALFSNNYSESVSIWWGRAGGMPDERMDLTTGRSDSRPAVADVDGDGRPDLVVANNDDARFSVLRSRGRRRFGPATHVFQSPAPRRPVLEDWTGDSLPELLFGHVGAPEALALRTGVRHGDWAPQALMVTDRIVEAVVGAGTPTSWVLLRGTDAEAPTWWRLDPRRTPSTAVPLELGPGVTRVRAVGEDLVLVRAHDMVRRSPDGSACMLATRLPNSEPLALADLDGDGVLDALRLDTCARCESNHVFVRGVR